MDFSNLLPSLRRTLNLAVIPSAQPKGHKIRSFERITFESVYFSYRGSSRYVLEDINFQLRKNEYVALVGKSGSGKSTFINMLLGQYQPLKGNISINGIDYKNLDIQCLQKLFGVVIQDSLLFNMSIKDNFYIVKPNATIEEMWRVCKQSGIEEYIRAQPNGLDTIIGEKGVKLSGGQRQRIAIARTLLLDSSILVFDESTSQLDHETEKMILNTLEKLAAYKTVIVIAHRHSSIQAAHRIVTFDNGRIVKDVFRISRIT